MKPAHSIYLFAFFFIRKGKTYSANHKSIQILFLTFVGKCKECNCGLPNRNRIAGGQDTEPHEYPWHVGITVSGQSKPRLVKVEEQKAESTNQPCADVEGL